MRLFLSGKSAFVVSNDANDKVVRIEKVPLSYNDDNNKSLAERAVSSTFLRGCSEADVSDVRYVRDNKVCVALPGGKIRLTESDFDARSREDLRFIDVDSSKIQKRADEENRSKETNVDIDVTEHVSAPEGVFDSGFLDCEFVFEKNDRFVCCVYQN